jgi:hypothetical protein
MPGSAEPEATIANLLARLMFPRLEGGRAVDKPAESRLAQKSSTLDGVKAWSKQWQVTASIALDDSAAMLYATNANITDPRSNFSL